MENMRTMKRNQQSSAKQHKQKHPQINQISQIRELIQQEKSSAMNESTNISSVKDDQNNLKMNLDAQKDTSKLKQHYSSQPRAQSIGKENTIQNQYKRAKESEKNLNDYQEKYERLEENFKKFTDNLYKRRQGGNQALNQTVQYEKSSSVPLFSFNEKNQNIINQNSSQIIGQDISIIEQDNSVLHDITLGNMISQPDINNQFSNFLTFNTCQNDRVMLLKQLILRMHTFAKNSITKLISLSVSKQQEDDLKELQIFFQQGVQESLYRLTEVDSLSLDNESEQLTAIFSTCLATLEERFGKIIHRICMVESETFKNYKFKDALVLFENFISEAHRFSFQEYVPQIAQMIVRLRFQSGMTMLDKIKTIQEEKKSRQYFLSWRQKSGLQQFITKKSKQTTFNKAVQRSINRSMSYQVNKYLHIWKQCSLQNNKQSPIQNVLQQLLLKSMSYNSETFNLNELQKQISDIMYDEFKASCEILTQESDILRGPSETQDCHTFKVASIKDLSITGQSLTKQIVINSIYGNKMFNEKVDIPLFKSYFKGSTDLNLLCVPTKNGIARFFQTTTFQRQQVHNLEKISQQVWHHYENVKAVTLSMSTLKSKIQEQGEQVDHLQFYQQLTQMFTAMMNQASTASENQFLQFIQSHFDDLSKVLFQGFTLRQIYKEETPLLNESNDLSIIRHNNSNKSSESDIHEDLLDYQKDHVIHQLQVHQSPYTFVFHNKIEKANKNHIELMQNYQKDVVTLFCQIVTQVMVHILNKQSLYHTSILESNDYQQRQQRQSIAKEILQSGLILKFEDYNDIEDMYLILKEQITRAFSTSLSHLNVVDSDFELYLNSNLLNDELNQGRLLALVEKNNQHYLESSTMVIVQSKSSDFNRIEISQSMISQEVSIMQLNETSYSIQVPIQLSYGTNLALIKFQVSTSESFDIKQLDYLKLSQELLQNYLTNVNTIRQEKSQYESSILILDQQVTDLKIDNTLKDRITEIFIYPLLQNPTFQQLNSSINQFCFEMIQIRTNKISFIANNVEFIYNNISKDLLKPKKLDNEAMLQCLEQGSAIIDESNNGTLYYPLMLNNSTLICQFSISDNATVEQVQHIMALIQPIINSFFQNKACSLPLPLNKYLLVSRLSSIIQRKQDSYRFQFFLALLEFQIKNSSNFTKTKIYSSFMQRNQLSPSKQYKVQKQVVQDLEHAISTLNSYAKQKKQKYFNIFRSWRANTQNWNVPKNQRKAIAQMESILSFVVVKRYFYNFVIGTGSFKLITRSNTKRRLACECILFNYKRIKQRLVLRKLKSKIADQQLQVNSAEVDDMKFLLELSLIISNPSLEIEQRLQHFIHAASEYIKENIVESLDQIIFNVKHSSTKLKAFSRKFINEDQKLQNNNVGNSSKKIHNQSHVEEVFRESIAKPITKEQESEEFVFSFKKDIIFQMLQKSKLILNFQNISQSLQELYMQAVMKHPKSVPTLRVQAVQKSKSALILPLVDINTSTLIGGVELYRCQVNSFNEDVENRLNKLTTNISRLLQSFIEIKASQSQVEQMKKQLQKNNKQTSSLSAYLKHVYFTTPSILNADKVLPILISNDERCNQKLAFFYQFTDNHIYNFNFEDTFIEEIVENGCALEVAPKDDDNEDEAVRQLLFDENESLQFGESLDSEDKQMKQARDRRVKSVSNEDFMHIIYYPILDKCGNTKAILEVCYNRQDKVPKQILDEPVKLFLDQFSTQISQFQFQLRAFCSSLSSIVNKGRIVQLMNAFSSFKLNTQVVKQHDMYSQHQQKTTEQTEHYFNEYINNLESYDSELRKLVDEREEMVNKMKEMKVEKKAKLKFLATALFFSTLIERKAKGSKIAQSAFNKVLEINHKHSYARFRAGCRLIDNIFYKVECREVKVNFDQILLFAKHNALKQSLIITEGTYMGSSQMLNTSHERSQIFGNVRGSYTSAAGMNQQMSVNKSQAVRSQSQLGFNPNPSQHSLSMALTDVSHPKRKVSKKKRQQ